MVWYANGNISKSRSINLPFQAEASLLMDVLSQIWHIISKISMWNVPGENLYFKVDIMIIILVKRLFTQSIYFPGMKKDPK